MHRGITIIQSSTARRKWRRVVDPVHETFEKGLGDTYQAAGTVAAVCADDVNSTSPSDYQSHSFVEDSATAAITARKKCWFCGGSFHMCSKCPAKDAECKLCGKTGHWQEFASQRAKRRSLL